MNCGYDENSEHNQYCEACGCELSLKPSVIIPPKSTRLRYDPTINLTLHRPSISNCENSAHNDSISTIGIENLTIAQELLSLVSHMTIFIGNTQLNSNLYEAKIELDKIQELLTIAQQINSSFSEEKLVESTNKKTN